jgi:hypothetical protein
VALAALRERRVQALKRLLRDSPGERAGVHELELAHFRPVLVREP